MLQIEVATDPSTGDAQPTQLTTQDFVPLQNAVLDPHEVDQLASDFALVDGAAPSVPDSIDSEDFVDIEAARRAELDALVDPAAKGDRDALARLLEIVRPIAVRYSRGKIGPGDRGGVTADDVAQEICLAVMTALPRYRDESRPFVAFVYGIAAHKIADVHRAAARNKAEAFADVPESVIVDVGPEDRMLASETSKEIGMLLATIPAKDRDVLVLRVALGLSAEEVAQSIGSTPGAIRVAQHRALTKLRAAHARMVAGEPLNPPRKRRRRARTPKPCHADN